MSMNFSSQDEKQYTKAQFLYKPSSVIIKHHEPHSVALRFCIFSDPEEFLAAWVLSSQLIENVWVKS